MGFKRTCLKTAVEAKDNLFLLQTVCVQICPHLHADRASTGSVNPYMLRLDWKQVAFCTDKPTDLSRKIFLCKRQNDKREPDTWLLPQHVEKTANQRKIHHHLLIWLVNCLLPSPTVTFLDTIHSRFVQETTCKWYLVHVLDRVYLHIQQTTTHLKEKRRRSLRTVCMPTKQRSFN